MIGASGMQGWRLEMEDAHIIVDMPSRKDHLFLAVFDGHAGAGAARYAAEHFVKKIEATSEWRAYLDGSCTDVKLLANVSMGMRMCVCMDMGIVHGYEYRHVYGYV